MNSERNMYFGAEIPTAIYYSVKILLSIIYYL
jgi:hypothetical protein